MPERRTLIMAQLNHVAEGLQLISARALPSYSLVRLRAFVGTFVVIIVLCLLGLCPPEEAMAQAGQISKRSIPRNFPLTKFYDMADPLPPGKPGELIRSVQFDAYDLPLHVSAVRFLYHSRSANGEDVASSGVVLFPDKQPPPGGWPVIAWAHDWNGVARQCAPSLTRNLQHGTFLSMYVNVGYAVVASDFTGLGTRFRPAFGDVQSSAWDVIYAIPAARSAVPQLGPRWIAMGTGEGGAAVVSVAELLHDIHDSNYLGSIALSGVADLQDTYEPSASLTSSRVLFLAYGIKTVYPQFEAAEILTDQGLSLYQELGQDCGESTAEQKTSAAAVLKPSWEKNAFVQKYFERNRLGLRSADAPLLMVGSADDPSTMETTKIAARLCRQEARVQFEKYAEYDPGRVIGDSVRDQMAWIQARFANARPPSNCPGQH